MRESSQKETSRSESRGRNGTATASLVGTALWQQMDTVQQTVEQELASWKSADRLVVGTTAIGATGLTVGYAMMLLRGGSLAASMCWTLPAWARFDPLPVLDSFDQASHRRSQDDLNGDAIESLIKT